MVIEYVVHEIRVLGLKTRVINYLSETLKCAFFKLAKGRAKLDFIRPEWAIGQAIREPRLDGIAEYGPRGTLI